MKTPKRYIEIAPFEYDPTEKAYPIHPEHILEQRFKRKNRIAQLKRTIARQAEEISNLRTLLESVIQDGVTTAQRAALDWAANNLQLAFHPQSEPGDGTPWFLNYKPVLTFPKGSRK